MFTSGRKPGASCDEEASHSGRVHRLGKAAYPKGYRWFESLRFRQDYL